MKLYNVLLIIILKRVYQTHNRLTLFRLKIYVRIKSQDVIQLINFHE